MSFFVLSRQMRRDLNNLNATRTSVAGEGWTEQNIYFLSAEQKENANKSRLAHQSIQTRTFYQSVKRSGLLFS